MAFDRYAGVDTIGFGDRIGTSRAHILIRDAVKNGTVDYETITLRGFERLDTIAGRYYGDGQYWWIIASASEIGWAPQVPPGTVLFIPNLSQVAKLVT